MRGLLFGLLAIVTMSLSAQSANAGAAVCRWFDSDGVHVRSVTSSGSGYSDYNTAISNTPAGALCWSSGNLVSGYFIALATSQYYIPLSSGGKSQEVAAGFGTNRNQALRDAINALERNAVLYSWGPEDGYEIEREGGF